MRTATLTIKNVPFAEVDGLEDCARSVGGIVVHVAIDDSAQEPQDQSEEIKFRLKEQPTRAPKKKVTKTPKRFTRTSKLQYVRRVSVRLGTQVDITQKTCADLRTFTTLEVCRAIPHTWAKDSGKMTTMISKLINKGGVKVLER